MIGKEEDLPLVPTPVVKDVPIQDESPDTDKTSDRDEDKNVVILPTDTSQKLKNFPQRFSNLQ